MTQYVAPHIVKFSLVDFRWLLIYFLSSGNWDSFQHESFKYLKNKLLSLLMFMDRLKLEGVVLKNGKYKYKNKLRFFNVLLARVRQTL